MEGKLLHALVLLAACGGTEATYKRWTKNTDFGNPSNWNLARLPCSNDRVVFPASSPVVAINQDWTLSNLILANDGIIILGDNVNLQFEENPPPERAECSRPGDIEYNNTLAAHWLDPNNWCIPMHDFDNLCFANIVQTHSEMVPCMTDDILFPGLLRNNHRSSFFINLDIGEDMEIASLKIGMNFLTTDSFQSYLDTDLGRKEFVRGTGLRPPTLSMSGRTCSDPAGCYCGTDQSPYKERICGYAGACPTVYCDNPITPTGHCCPVCGSKLEMEINRTVYSVFHIRELVQKDFIDHKDKDYSTVRFGMSRLSNGNSQLFMLDNSQGRQSSNMAAEVKSLLDQDMVGEKRYGVLDVSIATSGTPESTPSTTSTTTSPTTASTSTTRVTQPTVTTPQGPTQTSTVTSPSTPPVTHTTPTTQSTSSTTPSPTSTSTSALPPGVTSSTVTPATPEPTSTVAVLGSTAGQRENRTENPVTSETAIIVGSIMAAIVVLLIVVLGLICILGRRTAPSSDPLSVSIKYEDGANGHSSGAAVTFNSVGVENPMFSEETANGVQLTDMTSHDPSVSNIKTSTMKKQKSSKKKSSGFENPIYYSPKTETIGAGADEESHGTNGDITIGNPMYDEGFDGFEDNFM